MEKKLYIARPAKKLSIAILTSFVLLVGIMDASAHTQNDKAEPIVYVGNHNSIMTFNINYKNEAGEKMVLELTDQNGETLYRKVYSDKVINKNIYLKNAGEKCVVNFSLRSGATNINQKFVIDPKITMLDETVVTKL